MEQITIHSNLYDYTVDITDDFSKEVESFPEKTAYVIDQNVYSLYKEKQYR